MSELDIGAIRARCEAATKGPWYVDAGGERVVHLENGGYFTITDFHGFENNANDAKFTATARTDIPALLSHIATLENREQQALDAHLASFTALQAISLIVSDGSVDDYSEISRLVESRIATLEKEREEAREQGRNGSGVIAELLKDIHMLTAQLSAATQDRDAARKFVEWAMRDGSWQGCDIDGGDAQDIAEDLGLIVTVTADDEFRAEYDCDTMYVFAWADRARESGETG